MAKRHIALGTAALVMVISSQQGAEAGARSCGGLSGIYGNTIAIVVGSDGRSVNVVMGGGRPNAYGYCQGNSLTVNFADDRVIGGKFDGRTIFWDNNTRWHRR